MCQVDLGRLTISQLGYVTDSAAVLKLFPELTHLRLHISDEPGRILPSAFLGETVPRPRSLELYDVPFPGSLYLLSSTMHPVNLAFIIFLVPGTDAGGHRLARSVD